MQGYQFDQIDRVLDEKRKKGYLLEMSECNHGNIIPEYYGETRIDYICLNCGMQSKEKNGFSN